MRDRQIARTELKGLLTRRMGYPSKWVNPSWRVKDNPGLQANFTTARLHSKDLETIGKLSTGRRVYPIRSVCKGKGRTRVTKAAL